MTLDPSRPPLPEVDPREAVAFLQQLVRLDTVNPPGRESVAADLIQKYLKDGKSLEYVDTSAGDRVAVKPK